MPKMTSDRMDGSQMLDNQVGLCLRHLRDWDNIVLNDRCLEVVEESLDLGIRAV